MKNFRLLLAGLMVAGFAFTSCGDDDSTPAAEQASILGKWDYAQSGMNGAGMDIGFENYDHEAGCSKDHMELAEGGVYKDYWYGPATECTETVETSTYSLGNSSITFGTGEGAETWEIESVTSSTMRIRKLYSASEAGNIYEVETYTRH